MCGIRATTAECQARALAQCNSTSPAEGCFERRTRLAIHDQHPSNPLCERIMYDAKEDTWPILEIDCHMHMAALVDKDARQPFDSTISGLVNLSLSFAGKG